MSILIATANVQNLGVHLSDGNDLSRADVRKCGEALVKMGVTVAGLQEIAEVQDAQDIKSALPSRYEYLAFPGTANAVPIIYDTKVLTLQWTNHYMAHHGLAKVSPDRHTTMAAFTRVGHPNIPAFVVRNRHMVSKPTDIHAFGHDWRAQHWHLHWEHDKRNLEHLHGRGYSVFDVGDCNMTHVPKYLPNTRFLVNGGIDKVAFTRAPQSTKFEFIEQVIQHDPSDHDAKGAKGRLRAP